MTAKIFKIIYVNCDLRSNKHYLSSSENLAWEKNSGLYGIWNHDLCDTDVVLYQLQFYISLEYLSCSRHKLRLIFWKTT